MKALKKRQIASMNTLEAQASCYSCMCGGYCTCGGQSNSVFQSTNQTRILKSNQSSYNATRRRNR